RARPPGRAGRIARRGVPGGRPVPLAPAPGQAGARARGVRRVRPLPQAHRAGGRRPVRRGGRSAGGRDREGVRMSETGITGAHQAVKDKLLERYASLADIAEKSGMKTLAGDITRERIPKLREE